MELPLGDCTKKNDSFDKIKTNKTVDEYPLPKIEEILDNLE